MLPELAFSRITNGRRERIRFAPIRSLSPGFTRVSPLCAISARIGSGVPGVDDKTSSKKGQVPKPAPDSHRTPNYHEERFYPYVTKP